MASSFETVAFLGDSIFDNKLYIAADEKDVAEHFRDYDGYDAVQWARDGGVIDDVYPIFCDRTTESKMVPRTAVVSVGGNDALGDMDLLDRRGYTSSAGFLNEVSERVSLFRLKYERMLNHLSVFAADTDFIFCTIYRPNFPDLYVQKISLPLLSAYNDAIIEEVSKRGHPIIDLRQLFTDKSDYANAIEPSTRGSEKIAVAVATVLQTHDFSKGVTEIYGG